jgi:hypothetical protein
MKIKALFADARDEKSSIQENEEGVGIIILIMIVMMW